MQNTPTNSQQKSLNLYLRKDASCTLFSAHIHLVFGTRYTCTAFRYHCSYSSRFNASARQKLPFFFSGTPVSSYSFSIYKIFLFSSFCFLFFCFTKGDFTQEKRRDRRVVEIRVFRRNRIARKPLWSRDSCLENDVEWMETTNHHEIFHLADSSQWNRWFFVNLWFHQFESFQTFLSAAYNLCLLSFPRITKLTASFSLFRNWKFRRHFPNLHVATSVLSIV